MKTRLRVWLTRREARILSTFTKQRVGAWIGTVNVGSFEKGKEVPHNG